METSRQALPSPTEALADLDASAAARDAFLDSLTLPRGYSLITGFGNASFVYGIALGNSTWRFGQVAFVLGLVIQVAAAGIAIRRFRAENGAWISGFSGPRATRVVVAVFACVLIPCIIGATWLMIAELPVLSAAVALGAVPATWVADRWWMGRARLRT